MESALPHSLWCMCAAVSAITARAKDIARDGNARSICADERNSTASASIHSSASSAQRNRICAFRHVIEEPREKGRAQAICDPNLETMIEILRAKWCTRVLLPAEPLDRNLEMLLVMCLNRFSDHAHSLASVTTKGAPSCTSL